MNLQVLAWHLQERLAWKNRGASETFQALVSLNTFARSCMLCVHIATRLQEQELSTEKLFEQGKKTEFLGGHHTISNLTAGILERPCSCQELVDGRELQTVYHLYVREHNAFRYFDVFIGSNDLSLAALGQTIVDTFQAAGYVPSFVQFGQQKRFREDWKVFKVYPVLTDQRRVLFGNGEFASGDALKAHIQSTRCPRLEVIFI
jgi:glycoprotein 3-alpha-L-fucosyltransferase